MRKISSYNNVASILSYSELLTGNKKPLRSKKLYKSLSFLFGNATREPRILSSSVVPLAAILDSPVFALYPNSSGLSGYDWNLKVFCGGIPGEVCFISSTQSQE